jgi:stress-induced morphogen
MNSSQQQIYDVLQQAFQPEKLVVIDDSDEHIGHAGAEGGKGHFTIEIASQFFIGKSRLESHRMVYNALHELMQTRIHALRIIIIS